MFDIKRDLRILTSSVHAEWKEAIAKLKVEEDNAAGLARDYLVPYSVRLDASSFPRLIFIPMIDGLSEEGLAAKILPSPAPYYASDLFRFLISNPTLSAKILQEGCEVTVRISKEVVAQNMAFLAPEAHMRRVFQSVCNTLVHTRFRPEMADRKDRSLFLHVLFGLDVKPNASENIVNAIVRDLPFTDFGFRDVKHAERFLGLISDRATVDASDLIHRIDEFLAEHGRPIVRPAPSSKFLRKMMTTVKMFVV